MRYWKTKAQQQLRWATIATIDMGLKGGGAVPLSRSAGNPSNTMWPAWWSSLPYQVTSSSFQPFGHNSVGCHSLRRNISTNYYFVVEMHTVTVRSDDVPPPAGDYVISSSHAHPNHHSCRPARRLTIVSCRRSSPASPA